MASYTQTNTQEIALEEQPIYGSSRLGVYHPTTETGIVRGNRIYEGSNHLGNVLVTFSDRIVFENGDLKPATVSYSDYYAFGMPIKTRTNAARLYKSGFNGQVKDDEIYGEGNTYSAKFWEYDSRLGRRWNLDPKPNPSISDYACFANNPIFYSDPLGDTIKNKFEKLYNEITEKKSNFEKKFKSEYGENAEKLKKENFNTKTEWKAYKLDRKEFKNIKKEFNKIKMNYDFVNSYIQTYKQIDPAGFDIMDNLIIDGKNINIEISTGSPIDEVAQTTFQAYKNADGSSGIMGDIKIYISINVSVRSNVLAHEFGHINQIINNAWGVAQYIKSNPNHNCQDPINKNHPMSKEALFWQNNWDQLIKIK